MKLSRRVRVSGITVLATLAAAAGLQAVTLPTAQALSVGALSGAGPRPSATQLSFPVDDRMQAKVDVGSGNLLLTVTGLSAPGVSGSIGVSAFYNSLAASSTPVSRLGKGWGLNYTPDVRVTLESDSTVTYHGFGGLAGNFAPVSGSSSYTAPGGFKADLVKTASGWDLTERATQTKQSFDGSGALTTVTDRNGNATTVAQSAGAGSIADVAVVTPAGPSAARTISVKTTVSGVTNVTQASRSMSYTRDSASLQMTGVSDADGTASTFSYNSAGLLQSVQAPGTSSSIGEQLDFTYDSSARVTSVVQHDSSIGGAGDGTTRFVYQAGSPVTTLVASPVTNQSQAVTAVPHTTYTLNADTRVTKVVDAAGREQDASYTPNSDVASASTGVDGSSTVTNAYGANNGDSLTKSTTSTGASQSLGYGTAAPNQYLPSSGIDDSGNTSTFAYNGAGNQLSSTNASAAKGEVTWNSDGTPATAKSPNNGSNVTTYGYTNKQVTSITPVTGASLGVRNYTYDTFGRLGTSTDGRGITTTYTYDADDRITDVLRSTGSHVQYLYNQAHRLKTVNIVNDSSLTGNLNYTYDQVGRIRTMNNAAFGGTVTYTYDKNSRIATSTNPAVGGTVTYHYDDAGVTTSMDYPSGGTTKSMYFATDSHGRRTDQWVDANSTFTTWSSHLQTTYDGSNRVATIRAWEGTGDASNTAVVDLTYCHMFGTSPGACTASTAADRSKLAWKQDNLTGAATSYSYDTSGRLTGATTTGPNPATYTYGYNANGNRTSAGGTGQTAQTLTYNAANQITNTGYTYDGAGNLTADPTAGTMTYTAGDQLASVTKAGTTYTYKYGDRANTSLISQTTPNGTYQYAYGRTNKAGVPVLEEVSKDGASAAVLSDPVTGQPLLLKTSSGLQAAIINEGSVGSPIAFITSAGQTGVGYDYNPYGVPTLTNGSNPEILNQNPYTFAGGIADRTTGWIHFAARYYDARTGNFTQQDTVDRPLDPTNANRYAYAGDDPINNTDPTGRDDTGEWDSGWSLFSLTPCDLFGDAAGVGGTYVAGETGPVSLGVGLATAHFSSGLCKGVTRSWPDGSEPYRTDGGYAGGL